MAARWLEAFRHLEKTPELWRCFRRFENWATMTQHFFALPGSAYPVEVRTRSGLHITLQEFCDALAVWEMYCREQYRVPHDAQTIVDVGANIGIFTIWAARQAPSARVFSFEPFPQTFARLTENIRSHGLDSRTSCHRAGLAAASGCRSMSTEPIASVARALLPADVPGDGSVQVTVLTLAELIKQVQDANFGKRIDVLKLDIEGAEHEVLPGIAPEALAPVDLIEVEYHPPLPKEPIFDALNRAGFRCIKDAKAGINLGVAHFGR